MLFCGRCGFETAFCNCEGGPSDVRGGPEPERVRPDATSGEMIREQLRQIEFALRVLRVEVDNGYRLARCDDSRRTVLNAERSVNEIAAAVERIYRCQL